MMRFHQHPDGYLLESAPFGADYFWRPKQTPLGVGATAYVAKIAEEAKKLRALRELPGVLQGKGIPYAKDSQAYIVMRLMDGTALSDVIYARCKAAAPYDPAWVKSLASQLYKAVAGMHRRKVTWLDGKPDNILCCEDPVTGHLQITVCDFDASMWMRRGPLLRVSKIAVRGTEDFSSPELLTGIKLYEDCEYLEDLDREVRDVVAADAWSVGAIIFNAATREFLVPDGPAFKQAGIATSKSDEDNDEEDLRPAFVMRRHEQWKEQGMEEVWDRLRRATGNDAPLLDFLQQLLSLDPSPRADFAALANHPYLHLHPEPMADSPSAAAAAATAASGPAAAMPDAAALEEAVKSIPGVTDEQIEGMVAVLGIPFLVFDPSLSPVCETASGAVYRAWCVIKEHEWQQCLLKHHPIYFNDDQQAAMVSVDDRSLEEIQTAAAQTKMEQHLVGVFAPVVMTLKEHLQRRAAGQSVPALDFRTLALRLLQILEALHAEHHFLGVVEPDRIVVQPHVYLLELTPGDWSDKASTIQRTCPCQVQRLHHMGMSRLEACSAAADIYSAGVLLVELATGMVPFPGDVLAQDGDVGYMSSVMQQANDQAWRGKVDEEVVGPTAAQLLMAMLQFKPLAHPSAAQALHMPFFSQQPQDMLQDVPQTGQQSDSRSSEADAASRSQTQDGPPFTTHPNPPSHPTSTATPSSTPTVAPTSSGVHDEDSAASGNCSMQAEGAINIAARAGQGATSTAAVSGVTTDSNAAATDARSSASASSKKWPGACSENSKRDEYKPQTAHAVAKQPNYHRKHPSLGAAFGRATQMGLGAAGWIKDQAQAHPKTTIALAAVGCCALGFLARRRR